MCRLFGLSKADGTRLWELLYPVEAQKSSAESKDYGAHGNMFTKDSDVSPWLRMHGAEHYADNFKDDGFETIEHLMSAIEAAEDLECVAPNNFFPVWTHFCFCFLADSLMSIRK
eukprot:SAG31_NODE_823_length_11772_cov_10.262229_7_plen_114_part_00